MSTSTMAAASYRVLSAFFATHLDFTPTQADIASFERDLAVVSPTLMKDSLIELSQGRSARPAGAGQWRDAIYAIYNRKVAEHAQLFPVFHCFETAFRSKVAVTLEEHYRTPQWWGATARALASGGDWKAVTQIGVRAPVAMERRRAVMLMVDEMTRTNIDVITPADGYELLELSTLNQVRRLLESHWSLFRDMFAKAGQPIPPSVFLGKFDLMRRARNDVYHHTSFAGSTTVYRTAEDLLGSLGFPLPRIHKAIEDASCAPPPYF